MADDKQELLEELLDISIRIKDKYNEILEDEVKGFEEDTKKIKELEELLCYEYDIYKELNYADLYELLEEIDVEDITQDNFNAFNNADKFYKIANVIMNNEILPYFRVVNMLRDSCIAKGPISKYDEETATADLGIVARNYYADKMRNNLLIEFQLFTDLLDTFVSVLNDEIKSFDNLELKKYLTIYKYIVSYLYGRSDVSLVSRNKSLDSSFIYSRFIYDTLMQTDSEVSYSYEIIRNDYLEKALYKFLTKNNSDNINLGRRVVNISYVKAVIMLLGEDYKKAVSIYNSLSQDEIVAAYLGSVFTNAKSVVNDAKVLTLRP